MKIEQLTSRVHTLKDAKPAQGFAAIDPSRQREISSLGGKTAQAKGKAHKWTSERAREAALKSWASRKKTPEETL